MRAATRQTCDRPFDFAYASEIAPAIRATIDQTPRITLRRKWQSMTTLLVCDSQIATSLLPLKSMRWNPPPSFLSKLREDVSELVAQRAVDLRGMFKQPRI